MSHKEVYNCIVIDDEFLARKLLEEYISKIPQLNLIKSYSDPIDAIELLSAGQIDIMYIDIQMTEISGIDFIKRLPIASRPLTIFVTAYPQYAVDCFEIDAIEYLVKPTSFLRFFKATHKAIDIINTKRKALLWENNKTQNTKDYIIVKSDRKLIKLYYKDIYFIEGALEYVTFQKKDEKVTTLYSLKKLEEELPQNQFIRIHKSYIVSIDKISEIDGNQVKVGQWNIHVSKNLRPKLLDKFSYQYKES